MSQYTASVNVTNNGATVVIPGVDARPDIDAGDEFMTEFDNYLVAYYVSAEPTYTGGNTNLVLTAPYQGDTGTGVAAKFQTDFDELGLPRLGNGDRGTHGVVNRALEKIRQLFNARAAVPVPAAADAGKIAQVNDAGTAIQLTSLDQAIGRIMNPLRHIPLNGPNDAIRLQGEFQFLRESNATYVDRYGVVKSAPFDSGTPTMTTSNYVNDTGKSWTAGQWVGAVIELKDGGSRTAYRWITANSDTVAYWAEPVEFTVASYKISRLQFEADGLLMEGASTNLLRYSRQFDNAVWNKSAATITADAAVAPDGTTTADKLVESATTANHFIYQVAASSGENVFSVFAKAAERTWLKLQIADAAVANFDLANGVLGSISGTSSDRVGMEPLPNGWYRCFVIDTYAGPNHYIFPAISNNVSSYAGDGTSGIYIWEANVAADSILSSAVTTTSASATRTASDMAVQYDGNAPGPTDAQTWLADVKITDKNSTTDQTIWSVTGETTRSCYVNAGLVSAVHGTAVITGTTDIDDGAEHRVGVVFDGTDLTLYVDGVQEATTASPGSVSGTATALDIGHTGGAEHLYGTVRNFRIYDVALTGAEVRLA